MAQIVNSQITSQAITKGDSGSIEGALSKLNGQLAQLQTSPTGAAQLIMKGQTLLLPRLPNTSQQGQTVQLKIKEQATHTLLELIKPGTTSQSLQLTPTQSQQLLTSLANQLEILAAVRGPEVEAKVKHVVGNQLTLQVGAKAITLTVNNAAQQFKTGQQVSLKLANVNSPLQIEVSQPHTQGQNKPIQSHIGYPNSKQMPVVLGAILPKQTAIPLQLDDKASHFNIQKNLPASIQTEFKLNSTTSPVIYVNKQQQVKLQWNQTEPSLAKIPLDGQFKGKVADFANVAFGEKPLPSKVGLAPPSEPVKSGASTLSGKEHTEVQNIKPSQSVETISPATIRANALASVEAQSAKSDIQPLLRMLQAKIESPSLMINRLELALSSLKLDTESPVDKLISQFTKALDVSSEGQSRPTANVTAQEIKQIFNAATLPVSTQSFNAPAQNQSQLLSGLIGMMQVSLAARLANKNNAQLETITQLFSPAAAQNVKATTRQQVGKSLNEFLQADNKFQLLKGIDKLLSSHQYSKLSSAEAQLQGQESLYYVLPFGGNERRQDIEVRIRREKEKEQQTEKEKSKGTYWALTMKLPVGDIGQVLAKAKINGKNLDLDFYTSNTATRELVFNFIPLLKKRFVTLGIDMGKCQCQLGKIPDSLQERPYQLFEAKA
ncbi:hypothetical protein [Alteromonas sp. a30]|uniref:hypothetical protein n=1 Tax=Alteromonas sp. a30 TaxID=2730917 RepID=UPI00227E6080|nr:hypothetical protein [Alteromonas sp. a30]MCY7294406.1 hypothetical protein [Alteromonas sp. a30]